MSTHQDEAEDSRTSGVGRKRDLQGLMMQEDTGASYDEESTQQRSHKRAKQDLEISGHTSNEREIILDTSSPLMVEPAPPSHDDSIQISNAMEPIVRQSSQRTSWNKPVQGGLRTSFGSKAQVKAKVKSSVFPNGDDKDESSRLAGQDDIVNSDGDVTMDLQRGESVGVAEIHNGCSKKSSGDSLSMPDTDFQNAADVSYPAFDGEPRAMIDNSDLDINYQSEMQPSNPTLHDLLGNDENKSPPSMSDGSVVKENRITQEIKERTAQTVVDTNAGENIVLEVSPTETPVSENLNGKIYPRDLSHVKSSRVYTLGDTKFQLVEMLKNSNKISLEDMNFQDFALHFIKTNHTVFRLLKPKNVRGAFKVYLLLYYASPDSPALATALATADGAYKTVVKQAFTDMESLFPPLNAAENPEIKSAIHGSSEVVQVKDPRPPNVQEANSFQPSNAAMISFPPVIAARPSILTHSDATTPIIPGRAVGSDGDGVLQDGLLSDLPESTALYEDSAVPLYLDIDKVEMVLQQKYFPDVNGKVTAPRCLACAEIGHRTLDCPALSCTLCGDTGNHSNFTCPQNQRCGKCRQKGHSTKECPEKLFASKAEVSNCDLCKSSDHLEANCHYVWRSFAPKPEEIRTVSGIPVHCYSCGSTGHYGPQCGLSKGIILSGGVTWSESNLRKYLDVNSKDRAISAGVDYSLPSKSGQGFAIKGKAIDSIKLDDSDEDVSFIRPKVNKAAAKPRGGQIRFDQNSWPAPELPSNTLSARSPQRHAVPDFGYPRRYQDSARYGCERSFSPPPTYGNYDQSFPQDNRYRSQAPQAPYRQNSYRPLAGDLQGPPPNHTSQPARDHEGGGNRGRGGRYRGGGLGGGPRAALNVVPNEPQKKKKKKKKEKSTKADRGGKATH